jgi:hypothetical protein
MVGVQMQRLTLLILLLSVLFSFQKSNATSFNFLKNDSGQVVYLELKNDFNKFILKTNKMTVEVAPTLRTLIVSDYDKKQEFKKLFPLLLQFLENCPKLENLAFINTEENEGDFEMEHLAAILKSVENAPLKSFRWEYQDEIDDDGFMSFFSNDSSNILSRIKYISFRGTPFDKDSFFLTTMTFDSLQSLDLSYSIDSRWGLLSFLKDGSYFPRLAFLNFNGVDVVVRGKVKTLKPFPKLKKLSYKIEKAKAKTFIKRINKIYGLFKNLDTLFVTTQFEDEDSCSWDAEFIINEDNTFCKDNLGYNSKILKRLSALKFMGSFSRFYTTDTTKFAPYFKNFEMNPSVFFSTQKELDYFRSVYPTSKRKEIKLVGPLINKSEIESILDRRDTFGQVKNIYLVGANSTEEELRELRNKALAYAVHIHQVDGKQSARIVPRYNYFNSSNDLVKKLQDREMKENLKRIESDLKKHRQ